VDWDSRTGIDPGTNAVLRLVRHESGRIADSQAYSDPFTLRLAVVAPVSNAVWKLGLPSGS